MEIKVFDVVELKNGNRATILEIFDNYFKVEEVDLEGNSQGIIIIEECDISKIIYTK